jgi:hypothetical protein
LKLKNETLIDTALKEELITEIFYDESKNISSNCQNKNVIDLE